MVVAASCKGDAFPRCVLISFKHNISLMSYVQTYLELELEQVDFLQLWTFSEFKKLKKILLLNF